MVNLEDRPTARLIRVKKRRRRRKSKKWFFLVSALCVLLVSLPIFTWIEYRTWDGRYQRDTALAATGMQHLQKAESLLVRLPKDPFNAQLVTQVQSEFVTALTALVPLNVDLHSLPQASTSLPVYGSRLRAALHLVPLAIASSQAGKTTCDLLNLIISRFRNPLNVQGQGLISADVGIINSDLKQIKLSLSMAIDEANQLQPEDLQFDSHIGKLVSTLRKDVPMLQAWLAEADQFLMVAPTLLGIGTPTNYLLEVLDSTELRPAGGFIGNYGIVTLSGGRLASAHITDVSLLDRPFDAAGKFIPYPTTYKWFDLAPSSWSFRDSNLDADFPTAARYGESNYRLEGGNIPIQGVIAITPALIQHALAITGPIAVPEYQETVTAQNLIARIHFHELGGRAAQEGSSFIPSPDGHSSLRKRFTELLAEHFLARVQQLIPTSFTKFAQLVVNSIHSKDIQIYLNPSVAESMLQRYSLTASVQPTVDDYFFVVDANIAVNKANDFISYKLDDQVTIDGQGDAVHVTKLNYAWITPGPIYGQPIYRDYVRVYVPDGSVLQEQDGWQAGGTSIAFGHKVWAGLFTLTYGQTHTITLTWTVHHVAKHDTSGWHYQYLFQKQAGVLWALHLQVGLPTCAVLTGTWGQKVSYSKRVVALSEPLYEDTNVGIDYTCH